MAAAGTSPALNLREKLAELAGLKQRVSPDLVRCDFTNLVTNGTFDTDTTGWTAVNATLSVASGALRIADNGGSSAAHQAVSVSKDKAYRLDLELVATSSGNAVYGIGTGAPNGISTVVGGTQYTTSGAGQYSVPYKPTTTTIYVSLGSLGTESADFDNITLYEADPSDDAPWLRLPYGYKVGTRGMIVRDGVILHPSDYTEITDSGQTWIKPIVAPGVSTEFSIWGSPSYAV